MQFDKYDFIRGYVILDFKDSKGTTLTKHSGNQIVYVGRHQVARIICGDTAPLPDRKIDTLKVSNGAVPDGGNHLDPIRPNITNGGLLQTNANYIKAFSVPVPTFSAVSSTLNPVVVFNKLITGDEVNMFINEMGMFFGAGGPMFAHYTFSTMDLRESTHNSLEVTWKFSFQKH